MLKKIIKAFLPVAALLGTSAHAGLITSLDITARGIEYAAIFHAASQVESYSFNSLWDGNGNGNLLDDGAADAFDFLPTFWNDLDGATEARDQIIAALTPSDWLNVYGTLSDAFVIPVEFSNAAYIWGVGDSITNLFTDRSSANLQLRNTYTSARVVWVTFEERLSAQIPAPSTMALVLVGLLGVRSGRSMTRRQELGDRGPPCARL